MSAPFFKYGLFGDEVALIVAFVIGLGFGFFLERAGFGSARKLVAQFYLTDLAVFKVMFTAIVTAMLGLFYLSWFCWAFQNSSQLSRSGSPYSASTRGSRRYSARGRESSSRAWPVL